MYDLVVVVVVKWLNIRGS